MDGHTHDSCRIQDFVRICFYVPCLGSSNTYTRYRRSAWEARHMQRKPTLRQGSLITRIERECPAPS